MASCVTGTEAAIRAAACRDGEEASHLKIVAVFAIFLTSVFGVWGPVLLAKYFHGKPLYDKAILVIKCFAAGVILSTSLVHVLPEAFESLADCQVSSRHPWKDFPFAGLVTMIGAITALLVDLTASEHMGHGGGGGGDGGMEYMPVGKAVGGLEMKEGKCGADLEIQENSEEEIVKMKQRLVSQVLEIGIIFHSVIIGVTMGMSQNKCTIRPLIAALSFHQIFEGLGLGGCIAQAGFKAGTVVYMCLMFAVTTPLGIVLGMVIFAATGYDDQNPNALIMEGLLGSFSSGILIYMALVDLIALDFFHNKMLTTCGESGSRLKKLCFVALVLGSASMSLLALWA
ncbi:Zinc transporter 6 [Arabidopsis thaliana]|jgi:zinc transporter 1/2/3|uniref:Zinc transporter 6, chloroplastic n=3 Tax=Arabidopsis TaxID=3701 RepID=ZIP6_ARATH|nr:ZIP metal ion transporter family [Arabidopsis thaliana]O64738.1 RecName: Full=Zinc transporter 6, chloroplastic; AltName: Full=ZRT/IRT-like protein 6; Flags: Precursor [Arabidopsis thaliana]KAG7637931.1 Zinc/iron permease fungal/plant [Arabidopsis thaliana x Arabidopsis arenosa]AAC16964.1 putative Fe(II) transport protein [Arabidopsis thaliana]AAL38433.1 putative metal transporter ZIP6 [Arabidopsis thaliana]AAM14983.1 putative Fe(II) transport protein [Arabidopsis thaliana]AEC08342.1 ZIP m|eukprot:NP_180569.1 ZIP metal ion transporter family [Arabidopsis thaliana]